MIFKVMASCTNKVDHESTLNLARNKQQNKEESVSFMLKSYDRILLKAKVDPSNF